MRIVHVINSLATGGAERLVVQLAIATYNFGTQVEIVTLVRSSGTIKEKAIAAGIPVTELGESLFDPRLIFRIYKATLKADIVHVHLFPAQYLASFVPKKKLVFTEHSTHNRRMNSRHLRIFERFIYSRYSAIIAISSGVEQALLNHLRNIRCNARVVTVKNGVSDEFYSGRRSTPQGVIRIVSVGSLRPVKRHEMALQVLCLIPNSHLFIAGSGPEMETLRRQINTLGLSSRVSLLGEVENIKALYDSSDIFLSTSKYEGFGLAAAEAQACGLPVIGPDVPGFDEIVIDGETGFLYGNDSPNQIAQLILLAASPKNYTRLAQAARVHSGQFRMAKCSEEHSSLYRAVMLELQQ